MPHTVARPVPAVPLLALLCLSAIGCSATPDGGGSRSGGSGAAANGSGGSGASGGAAAGGTSSGGSGGSLPSGGSGNPGSGGGAGGTPAGGGSSGGGGAVHAPADLKLPYSEDFEDGVPNNFIDSIDDEQEPLGAWAIVDDGGTQVYQEQVVTSDPSWAVGGDYRWTDQHLETRVKFVSGADEGRIILAVRFTSFDYYYSVEATNDEIRLYVVNDDDTELATWDNPMPFVDGEWRTLGLSAIGSSITVYLDGAPVLNATDAVLTAGGVALAANDAVVAFDDLTITPE